jgi:hypothetical protein
MIIFRNPTDQSVPIFCQLVSLPIKVFTVTKSFVDVRFDAQCSRFQDCHQRE